MEKLIYGLNAILLLLIALYEYNSDSDKSIILSSIAFVILFGINLLLGLSAQFDKKPIYRHYYYSALGLFVSVVGLLYIYITGGV
jgi:magnesium-transporting ATPase (P-type)